MWKAPPGKQIELGNCRAWESPILFIVSDKLRTINRMIFCATDVFHVACQASAMQLVGWLLATTIVMPSCLWLQATTLHVLNVQGWRWVMRRLRLLIRRTLERRRCRSFRTRLR